MRVGANYEEQAANVDASGKKVLVEVAGRSPLLRWVGSWEFYCAGAAGSHFAGYGDYSAEKFGELFVMARPSPVPFRSVSLPSTCPNSSNMRSRESAGIPAPVSFTETDNVSASGALALTKT